MLKLDPQSQEKVPDSVDFFSSKPTLIASEHVSTIEYMPMNPLPGSPIKFRINSGATYIDLSKLKLVTSFRILRKEGDRFVKIEKADPVSFIQGFGSTFIKHLKVAFNGRTVFTSNELYAYNAYMRRRLGLGGKQNNQELESAGWFEDGLTQISGPGFEARRALFENDTTYESVVTLDADIFKCKKLLLNETVVDIEIMPHNNFFALINTGQKEYKYDIVDCKLYVKQTKLIDQLNMEVQEQLNKNMLAKYEYTKVTLLNYFVSPGRYDFNTTLFTELIPKRVFAGLVDAKAFNGHIGMSPFEFAPHGLQTIKLTTNGTITPTYNYSLNWDRKIYGRAFDDMVTATGGINAIDIHKYAKHSCFYAFDLRTDHTEKTTELLTTGNTSISLNFLSPVPATGLQLVIYAEFNSMLALDKGRVLTTANSV